MRKLILTFFSLCLLTSCNSKLKEKEEIIQNQKNTNLTITNPSEKTSTNVTEKNISEFVPKGYYLYKDEGNGEIKGDLNNDGLEDRVLLIKGTDKSKFVNHESRGKIDRNRRGILILFNKDNSYELAIKNFECFSSENEDGGVYIPPDLNIYIKNGNLFIHYGHGRYGYWLYNFRYKNDNFELIGYDESSNRGPIVQYVTSINFLTNKILKRENLNKDNEENKYEEKYKDTWETIKLKSPIKITEIKDFDELRF